MATNSTITAVPGRTTASAARPAPRTSPNAARPAVPTRTRARRQSTAFGIALLATGTVLVGTGVAVGAGLGAAVKSVRSHLPSQQVQWAAHKIAEPQPWDTDGPATACPSSSLDVRLSTNADHISSNAEVGIEITVVNVGIRPCLVDGGIANREVVVTDGAGEMLWNSAHCESGGSRDLLLGPGDEVHHALNWSGRTSTPADCGTGRSRVSAGPVFVQAALPKVASASSNKVQLGVSDAPAKSPAAAEVKPSEPAVEEPAPAADQTTEPEKTTEAKATETPAAADPVAENEPATDEIADESAADAEDIVWDTDAE